MSESKVELENELVQNNIGDSVNQTKKKKKKKKNKKYFFPFLMRDIGAAYRLLNIELVAPY